MKIKDTFRKLQHDVKDFLTEEDVVQSKKVGSPDEFASRGARSRDADPGRDPATTDDAPGSGPMPRSTDLPR